MKILGILLTVLCIYSVDSSESFVTIFSAHLLHSTHTCTGIVFFSIHVFYYIYSFIYLLIFYCFATDFTKNKQIKKEIK